MNKTFLPIVLLAALACACSANTDGSGGASGGSTVATTVGAGSDYSDPNESFASECELYAQEVTLQSESAETVVVELPVECQQFWLDTGRPVDDDNLLEGADFIRVDPDRAER